MDAFTNFKLQDDPYLYTLTGLTSAIILFAGWKRLSGPNLDGIPTIGPEGFLSSYSGAIRYIKNANMMVQEGYDKYKGLPFKLANFDKWIVIISGPKLVEELRQAPDDTLSFSQGVAESLAIEYTLGREIDEKPYHIAIIRSQLTRSLASVFPDVRDEITHAFDDIIPPTDDWTKISVTPTVMQIVCRTSNRLFVGIPLCRNEDWQALNVQFTIDVVKGAAIINLFPNLLKPLVARLMTNVPASINRGMRHMGPIIAERQRHIDEYGKEWEDKPNDMLSWLLDEAPEDERSIRSLTLRILAINFAAIHTSSMSFSHALYHLAAMPQYIRPMREEVESIVNQEGWNKSAIVKMRKVDSFLKESQRFNGLGAITMNRKALKNFTFSDGTMIPKGTLVYASASPLHHDGDIYSNPDVFDGFRFANMRMLDGESHKNQFVTTDLNFLAFGHGRHACPGRFFAANELKAMMAHLVLNYDIKLEKEGVRPPNEWFAASCIPNTQGEVLFRKRQS